MEDKIKKARKASYKRIARRNRESVARYLEKHPCVDCGEQDIRLLEFDHVRGNKSATVSSLKSRNYSIKKIMEEIAKCEVRCVRCHRLVTLERLSSN